MYVGGNVAWKVEVDYIIDTLKVDATRCARLMIVFLLSAFALRFARRLLQQMLIGGNYNVVDTTIKLIYGMYAYIGGQL